MHTYLVVGASRGIGLGFVEELLKDPDNHVLATARAPARSPGLQALTASYPSSRLSILELDITDTTSVSLAASRAAASLGDGVGLDCLIHNAVLNLQVLTPFEDVDLAAFQEELHTNTVAPLGVVRAFLPLLRQSAKSNPGGRATKLVFMSSGVGSIAGAPAWAGLSDTYSVTKVGLNMLARRWGATLKKAGICTVILHPGWVDTDLGSFVDAWMAEHAPQVPKLSRSDCAVQCLRVVRDAQIEDAVSFYSYDGSEIPW
ncbi:NAD(P)-binding protein [Daedalea quercina L-15889]|uniref:NAD(P)-binding protein n=1 Tax=Daedalea quercina L-15889 TaxID=1314783 RepID=A0A165NYB0_9APHY|nr:NAD(P)-binding protein [Daedalea quercina L-15889]